VYGAKEDDDERLVDGSRPARLPAECDRQAAGPPPQSLDGKRVYLVDCLFDNSEVFMDQLQDWFGKNLPSVQTDIIKPRESWVDDPDMRKKVEEDGDAAILGVGL
jgi:hypothetical protein